MKSNVKLTSLSKTAGWAAKIGPETLAQVLSKLPQFHDDNLLVGIETSDDAAIYKITDDRNKLKSYIMFRGGIIWHLLLWLPVWVVDLGD